MKKSFEDGGQKLYANLLLLIIYKMEHKDSHVDGQINQYIQILQDSKINELL